jgi:hypothetical protein
MVKVKEMPYSEKYAIVQKNIKFEEEYVPSFIQRHLGNEAVAELQSIWQEGTKPIPENTSDEEKYEIAYGNWISIAKSEFKFIRERLGEDGIEQFKRAEVEALIRDNAGPALFMLKLVRAISPGSAFSMIAKQMAYQLQWITPYSVSELTRHRAVFDIPSCKILDFPDNDDLCLIGCQSIYPMWVAEQFKTEMKFERQGNSCICTLAPLR